MVREESIENDALEVADLEYEVGGMGAEEPANSSYSMEGFVFICVMPK